MTPEESWLAAIRPFVRTSLPAAPARVLEIGCGPLGGFVPELRAAGYAALGVDPEAPEGPEYRRVEFELLDHEPVDAIVACVSLHHVADLGDALDKAQAMLAPAGTLVVVEWASERFDEATAAWCFERLSGDGHGWLQERQAEWRGSGEPWDAYLGSWTAREGLHRGHDILQELDDRFTPRRLDYGPYFFPDLHGVTEADEQAAIGEGQIQAARIEYAGTAP